MNHRSFCLINPHFIYHVCYDDVVTPSHKISSCKSHIQWNLVIKRSDITKPSYNKVILLVPPLYISLFFPPDIMRNLI